MPFLANLIPAHGNYQSMSGEHTFFKDIKNLAKFRNSFFVVVLSSEKVSHSMFIDMGAFA